MSRSALALQLHALALATILAGGTHAQTPPGCTPAHVTGIAERTVHYPPWGPSHFVDIHHDGALYVKIRFRGHEWLLLTTGSPVGIQVDKNCTAEPETMEVQVWRSCEEPGTASFQVQPAPPELSMDPVKGPPGVDPSGVVIPWRALHAWPPRLRGVVFPANEVIRDQTGWDGTRMEGVTGMTAPAEGILKIELSACGQVQEKYLDLSEDECDKDCDDKCSEMPKCSGDPVSTLSGSMRYEDVDPVPANAFLPLRRTYLSRRTTAGVFGKRWFSMFDASLKVFDDVDGTRFVSVTTESGGLLLFSNRSGAFEQVGPAGPYRGKLAQAADGSWTQTNASGALQRVFDAQGAPVAFRDVPSGREVRLTWSAGLPVRVEDSWGNWALNVAADAVARRITSMSVDGQPGMIWTYVYDTHLVRVDSPLGVWRTYQYAESHLAAELRHLTAARDGADKLIESHAYDSAGRATSSYGSSGDIDSIAVRQDGRDVGELSATIHHTTGRTEKHYRRWVAGAWRTVEVAGGCTTCGQQTAVAVYDAHGNVVRAQAADGFITSRTYDPGGQNVITERTALRPTGCDPATAPDRCLLTTDGLADVELVHTSATSVTTYSYDDANWPERPTATTTASVLNPAGTGARSSRSTPRPASRWCARSRVGRELPFARKRESPPRPSTTEPKARHSPPAVPSHRAGSRCRSRGCASPSMGRVRTRPTSRASSITRSMPRSLHHGGDGWPRSAIPPAISRGTRITTSSAMPCASSTQTEWCRSSHTTPWAA